MLSIDILQMVVVSCAMMTGDRNTSPRVRKRDLCEVRLHLENQLRNVNVSYYQRSCSQAVNRPTVIGRVPLSQQLHDEFG